VTYAYDANDRLIERILPGSLTANYTYDPNGNLLTADDANSGFTMTYDARNRPLSFTDNLLGKSVTAAYDAAGRRIRLTRPQGDEQSYTFDANGRVTEIVADGTPFRFAYDAGGRRVRRDYPNGVFTAYAWDANNRMTSLTTSNGSGVLQSFTYTYDGEGNLTREVRQDGTSSTMIYDVLNRLVRETRTGLPAYDITYTLDALGNILGASGTPFFPTSPNVFTYNAANQLVTETGIGFGGPFNVNYTHDANGNLIRRSGTGQSTVTYTYDALNRLISAADSGVGTETYAYDSLGRLYTITVPTPVPGEPGFQRLFYDLQGKLIAIYDSAGAVLEEIWNNSSHAEGPGINRVPVSDLAVDSYIFIAFFAGVDTPSS
jgi:YD repeat-containing protein